jgi:hypothetical protein
MLIKEELMATVPERTLCDVCERVIVSTEEDVQCEEKETVEKLIIMSGRPGEMVEHDICRACMLDFVNEGRKVTITRREVI